MKVGDLVQVVKFCASSGRRMKVIYTGMLLVEQHEAYYHSRRGHKLGPHHPYEILLGDGTILRDWANIWRLETWSDDEGR